MRFLDFWLRFPALFYSLVVLIAIQMALDWQLIFIVPIGCIFLPFVIAKNKRQNLGKLVIAIALSITVYFYVSSNYLFPDLKTTLYSSLHQNGDRPHAHSEAGGCIAHGKASFQISTLQAASNFFGKHWIYKGYISHFEGEDSLGNKISARNIPCQIRIVQKGEVIRPPADVSYQLFGTLKKTQAGRYFFSVKKDLVWLPEKKSKSLAELRYDAKTKVAQFIKEKIETPSSASFLSGIVTGDFDDRIMSLDFSRFGLQHIMAISGFHFAILAALLNFFLRFYFGKRWAAAIVILLLSCYFLFLGFGPSILRAYVAIVIFLMSQFFERQSSGLNSLGLALLITLIIDPLMLQNLGFQFSFLVTAAILVFFAPIDHLMKYLLLKRSLSFAKEMDCLNQYGLIVVSLLRSALSLTIAVNLIAIPLSIYFFQKFPILSLVYNLFFPFLVSISMFLLLLAIPLYSLVPFLGKWLFALNSWFTQFMLEYTSNLPISLDFWVRSKGFSAELLIFYLSSLFCLGILLQKEQEDPFYGI